MLIPGHRGLSQMGYGTHHFPFPFKGHFENWPCGRRFFKAHPPAKLKDAHTWD